MAIEHAKAVVRITVEHIDPVTNKPLSGPRRIDRPDYKVFQELLRTVGSATDVFFEAVRGSEAVVAAGSTVHGPEGSTYEIRVYEGGGEKKAQDPHWVQGLIER